MVAVGVATVVMTLLAVVSVVTVRTIVITRLPTGERFLLLTCYTVLCQRCSS